MLIELLEEPVLWLWKRYTKLRRCIGLYLVQELRHLLRVELAAGVVDTLQLLTDLYGLHQELLAVVHIDVILRCACLTLDARQPHPHQIVLRHATLLAGSLDGDMVRAIRQRAEHIGQLRIERQTPILLSHNNSLRHSSMMLSVTLRRFVFAIPSPARRHGLREIVIRMAVHHLRCPPAVVVEPVAVVLVLAVLPAVAAASDQPCVPPRYHSSEYP